MLRLVGAELVEVPAVPYSNPNNYVKYSGRLADILAQSEPNGAVWANQFDNVANRRGHYETTGPEIYADTQGRIDGFVSAVGSGGTLAGVGMALKERDPRIKIALADPYRRGALFLLHRGRPRERGLLDHRGHRPGAHHRQSRRRAGRFRLPDRRRGGGAASSSISSSAKACCSAAPRGSTSPARSGSRASSAPATPSSRCCAIRARATPRNCSTRLFCAPRISPSRPGSNAAPASRRLSSDMTEPLFREDPYRREVEARVLAAEPGAIVLDAHGLLRPRRRPAGRSRPVPPRRRLVDRNPRRGLRRRPPHDPASFRPRGPRCRPPAKESWRGSTGTCAFRACARIARCIS